MKEIARDLIFQLKKESSNEIDRTNKTLKVVLGLLRSVDVVLHPEFNGSFRLKSEFGTIDLNQNCDLEVTQDKSSYLSEQLKKKMDDVKNPDTPVYIKEIQKFDCSNLSYSQEVFLQRVENVNNDPLYNFIDDVLLNDWDPIGVCSPNEYRSYTPLIYYDVLHGRPEEEIALKLQRIERFSMGSERGLEVPLRVANRLMTERFKYIR